MPTLNAQYDNLIDQGPMIEVYVGSVGSIIDLENQIIKDISKAERIKALIDTGSNRTMISEAVAERLQLKSTGIDSANTAINERFEANIYKVDFVILDCNAIADLEVRSANLTGREFECLIGRDVLSFAKFEYDGKSNKIILEY